MNSSTNPQAPVNDASLETHVTRMARNAAVALGYDLEYYRTCYDRTTDHYALHQVGIPAVEFDWRANAEGTSFEAYYHTRYAKYANVEVTAYTDYSNFEDADTVSGYAVVAMSWAVAEGIVKGTSGNRLEPYGTATRGQVAAVIMRLDILAKN